MNPPERHAFAEGGLSAIVDDDVATILLDHPERRNAINTAMWEALPTVIEMLVARRDTKVIIVTGEGNHFAAGADIVEFDRVFADRTNAAAYQAGMRRALDALADCGKPTIASIRGDCIGAGVAIALACDIRVAAADARLGVTPARLGLMYSLDDTRRLVAAVGGSMAKDLLFTGRLIDASAAQGIGLLDEVHDAGSLSQAVRAKAALIAANSQWSVRRAKQVVAEIGHGTIADTDETRRWFVDAIETDDYREGLAAFKAKRKPRFPFR